MKILKEAKEELPVGFLTNFVSEGWDKVGMLKSELESIKSTFKGTKKVEGLIQDLIDAYLVCIGQIEQHIADKDYLDFEPVEGVKEALSEDVTVNIDSLKVIKPKIKIEHEDEGDEVEVKEKEIDEPIEEPVEKPVEGDEKPVEEPVESEAPCEDGECEDKAEGEEPEKFEYFVDEFPEPVKEHKPEDEE